jgi:hypothetical protein
MAHRASTFGRGRVLAALALVVTTLLAGCDMLDLAREWSTTDDFCTDTPSERCNPPPAP